MYLIGFRTVGSSSAVPTEDDLHPVYPQPHGPPPPNPPHWGSWPYDDASDDDEYGQNVPAWYERDTDDVEILSELSMEGLELEGEEAGVEGGAVGAEEEDAEMYAFGDFYDPFNRRMVRSLADVLDLVYSCFRSRRTPRPNGKEYCVEPVVSLFL
jgi:hypothetical protein